MTLAAASPTSSKVTGYFLINGGSNGQGVMYATGPVAGTKNSVFLGNTKADIQKNFQPAIHKLGLLRLYGVDPLAVANTAAKSKVAWYRTTPSDVAPDNDLIWGAASIAAGGGVISNALRAVMSAARLTNPFGIDESGGTAPSTTAPDLAGSGDGAAGGADATQVEEATNPDETTSAKDENALKAKTTSAAAPAASGLSGLLKFLEDLTKGGTWLRVAEFIGGILLGVFALYMFGRIVDNSGGGSGGGSTRIIPL